MNSSMSSASSLSGYGASRANALVSLHAPCRCAQDFNGAKQADSNFDVAFLCERDLLRFENHDVQTFGLQEVSWHSTPKFSNLIKGKPYLSVFLSRCFLQKLSDPRSIFYWLKRLGSVELRLIIPQVEFYAGARQWTRAEIRNFLMQGNFIPASQDKFSEFANFYYRDSSSGNELSTTARGILIASEDSRISPTGGIGTYNAVVGEHFKDVIVLNVGVQVPNRPPRVLNISDLVGELDWRNSRDGLGLVEAIHGILYLHPHISVIEVPDFGSFGYRLVQAKTAGILPGNITIRIFLHGNIDYLKNQSTLDIPHYSVDELKSAVKDAVSFSGADVVRAPTSFILSLMREEFGYEMKKTELCRLPFYSKLQLKPQPLGRAKKLIFVGKFDSAKGWPLFTEALSKIESHLVDEVIAFAPGEPDRVDEQLIRERFRFSHSHLKHDEFMKAIDEHRADSIFVLPYTADNHPFSVVEQLLAGTRFVTLATGGTPELFPQELEKKRYLSERSASGLASKVRGWLELDSKHAQKIVQNMQIATRHQQDEINQEFSTRFFDLPQEKNDFEQSESTVTVITPFYNTPIYLLEELAESIVNQTRKPNTWLIVDDGSNENAKQELHQFVDNLDLGLEVSLFTQENKGLSAARNSGLAHVKTDYVLVIDSDDVLAHDAIEKGSRALTLNADALCASGFGIYFESHPEQSGQRKHLSAGKFHMPIGSHLARAIALVENEFMTSCAIFRTQLLMQLGGWDSADKSTWEDWALYLRASWLGFHLIYIPDVFFGYRINPNGMSKTYPKYPGFRRLVRNTGVFTKLDSNILMSRNLNSTSFEFHSETEKALIQLWRSHRLEPVKRIIYIAANCTPRFIKTKMLKFLGL